MFRVPEKYRYTTTISDRLSSLPMDGNNGIFEWREDNKIYSCIASDGAGWEHVSVHINVKHNRKVEQRTPTWTEMCVVKNMFWSEEDVVVQFHPKKSEYVNNHENVLHLWRPIGEKILTPPSILVGVI